MKTWKVFDWAPASQVSRQDLVAMYVVTCLRKSIALLYSNLERQALGLRLDRIHPKSEFGTYSVPKRVHSFASGTFMVPTGGYINDSGTKLGPQLGQECTGPKDAHVAPNGFQMAPKPVHGGTDFEGNPSRHAVGFPYFDSLR